jgi:hypothetical protein
MLYKASQCHRRIEERRSPLRIWHVLQRVLPQLFGEFLGPSLAQGKHVLRRNNVVEHVAELTVRAVGIPLTRDLFELIEGILTQQRTAGLRGGVAERRHRGLRGCGLRGGTEHAACNNNNIIIIDCFAVHTCSIYLILRQQSLFNLIKLARIILL